MGQNGGTMTRSMNSGTMDGSGAAVRVAVEDEGSGGDWQRFQVPKSLHGALLVCCVSAGGYPFVAGVFLFFGLFFRVQIAISRGWHQDQRNANSRQPSSTLGGHKCSFFFGSCSRDGTW